MNHIYGVNKYTYARYCAETDIFFFKLPELDPDLVVKFPGPDPNSRKYVTIALLVINFIGAILNILAV
jgi:hypothetical protein